MVGLALAHALRSTDRVDEAIDLLTSLIERPAASTRERAAALALFGEISHDRGDVAGRDGAEQQLVSEWPDDPNAQVAAAAIARAAGRVESAIEYLRNALAAAEGNLKDQIAFELADALIAAGRLMGAGCWPR